MIDPALIAAAVAEVEAEQRPRRQPTSQDLSYLVQAVQEATRENQLAEARLAQAEQNPWQNLENLDIEWTFRETLRERDVLMGSYAAHSLRRAYGPR